MQFFLRLSRSSAVLAVILLVTGTTSHAQQSAKAKSSPPQAPATKAPPPPKHPALVDPAGPSISLQTSETMFDIAVALNACGYDNGLATSDPLRTHVREQVNEAVAQSATARDARDQLCAFIEHHRAADSRLDLAQYVSLALYITPPPDLLPSVEEADMPPDSTQVEQILPLLRSFAQAIDLHVIWLSNHPAYEALVAQLHDPITKMIVNTNVYLKMPASTYDDRRFLVVLEPLLSPAETNARVYGTDYVVVASPVNGMVHMQEVRHTYLHYEIESLLYARATATDRLLPLLKTVRDAPLDYRYRSDIVALVIESMIRAIEARTMETGVPVFKIPENVPRSQLEQFYREHSATIQQDAAIRQKVIDQDMSAGFVLTQYFYNTLGTFEHSPASLKESIGEMVYGMDVDSEVHRARNVQFAEEGSSDVIRRAPAQPRGLDLAELDLVKGDAKNATQISQQALQQHTSDAARANFILARADLMSGKIDDAEGAFRETIRLSSDPRMLAWSHIYLGRILDVEEKRDDAVVEYKAALTVRDSQPDTKLAAEKGLKQPFALPTHQVSDDDGDNDSASPAKTTPPPSPPAAQQPQ